jgi:hypothetical protein
MYQFRKGFNLFLPLTFLNGMLACKCANTNSCLHISPPRMELLSLLSRPERLRSIQRPIHRLTATFHYRLNKASGTWRWPMAFVKSRGLEQVENCLHIFDMVHGQVCMVINAFYSEIIWIHLNKPFYQRIYKLRKTLQIITSNNINNLSFVLT